MVRPLHLPLINYDFLKIIFRFFSTYNQGYVETYCVVIDELLIFQSAEITDLHDYLWLTWCWIKPGASSMLDWHSTN